MPAKIRIGVAGWSVPATYRKHDAASHLAQYAAYFDCVEINSSFYKSHRPATFERWAASVPREFKFAVKVPKAVTHEHCLVDCNELVTVFRTAVAGLGEKLAVLLVQLPPSLAFDERAAAATFTQLKRGLNATLVCEARHLSWFSPAVDRFLSARGIARVRADPPVGSPAHTQSIAKGLSYFRLHGRPRMYYSSYSADSLRDLGGQIRAAGAASAAWCMFDNTALGAAWPNALALKEALRREPLGGYRRRK